MQKFIAAALGTAITVLALTGSGCVYKIDIPQGTPLARAQAAQVKTGMTPQQVRFLLGSPTVSDPLNPNRWDYIYNFIPGTYSKKANLPVTSGQHLQIYFDQGVVVRIEGLNTIPATQPGLPASREAILTAPPL